jgi:transposase-like protein
MGEKRTRAKYTLEFKMEAVRLVRNGQSSADVAKILGVPKGSLENWIRWDDNGSLTSGKDKVISQEQMELARLRAELARVKMERDILKKATEYFAKESL